MAGISHTEGRFTAANISMWLCAAGAGVGVAGLIGWLTGMLWLLRILPDLPPMMPNAALALIAIGIAGAVCHAPGGGRGSRAVSIVGGLVGLAIGVGTLAEYGSGIELRILNMSRILIAAQPPAPPGPPSPFTAVALVFLAAAILLIEVRPTARVRPSELLVLCAGFVTFTVLSGMILGAEPFYRLTRTPVIGTSLPTAVGLVLISIGLLVEPARGGAVRIASSPGPGGMLIRRLALPAIVVPLLLGLGVIRLLPTADIGYAAVPIAMLAASMTAIALILMVVNATPLNRAYEDAQASRTRINQLVEHAPDGIFVADLNGRYTDVNDAGCRLLGYSREEIVGKTIVDLIPPTDAERLWQSRDALMAGGVQVAEWTLRRRDGSLVPVEVSAKILEDGRWQGFVRDISERKRMEDERQVFISLLENSSDFIGIAGPDGKPLYVNPAGRRMVGLSADYPVETTQIPEYYPPDQRAFVSDVIVPSVLQLGRWEGDTYFRNWQTQEPIPVSDEHFLIRDPKTGRTLGMGTVTRNMTVARRIAAERETLLAREQRARQQAESANEQLRESEERFRLALDEAPIGMALVALDGRFFRVNRVLCEIVGYTAEELTGLTFQAITHPDDLDADLALAGQLLRGEIPRYQLEKRYIRKDGTLVDIMLSGSILRGRSGEALYFISQIEDITARKRLADNLRLSEAKATGILAISSDAIVSIDEEQRITQFNEGAEKIFGYSKAEATGAPLEILIPQRLRPAHHLHVARFAKSADVARKMGARNTVIIGLRKNGQEFPADAAISKLDVGGNRVFTVAVRDFTEQKRIEDEQRLLARVGDALATTLEREQSASRVAEAVVEGFSDVCIVDLIDDEGAMTRFSAVKQDGSSDSIHKMAALVQLGARCPPLVKGVLESGEPFSIRPPAVRDLEAIAHDAGFLRALRALQPQSLIAVPLVARGRLLGAAAFLSAVPSSAEPSADLHTAQEIARRAALGIDNADLYLEAQRATQLRDEVLGIVAHDLRNPLSIILMETQMLAAAVGGRERQARPPERQIQRAAMRMNRLIQDLLDVTRLEAGRLALECSRISAAAIAAEAAETQKALAQSNAVDLRVELPPQLPDIDADRDRLLQVFENLIGNAIKFTPAGGQVIVGGTSDGRSVRYYVRDTGSGIAVEDQPHVFDRFWQARATKRAGAGLGLRIVKGIVEAHGGRVWVESTPGRGSTFYFEIPVRPSEERLPSRRGETVEAR